VLLNKEADRTLLHSTNKEADIAHFCIHTLICTSTIVFKIHMCKCSQNCFSGREMYVRVLSAIK